LHDIQTTKVLIELTKGYIMQKHFVYITVFLVFTMLLGGCKSKNNNSKPIAKVYDKYLYESDIEGIFPTNASASDSSQILMAFVDRWVRKQLLLNRAERNLTDKQKNVSQQLEDYRSSLLIFKYEQEFIRQKLDTIIHQEEIDAFYKENNSNFMLNESIVKALFIKIRLDDTYYDRIKALYRSSNEDDIKTLDNIAYQVAVKYDYFNDKWIPFSRILRELPDPINNPESFLLNNRSIEMSDGTHSYLVSFRDIIHKGQQSPLSYEIENIQSIILNKRKQRLITDLETKIYIDARNHNHFTVYLN
jgi:hypothetical protein